MVRESVREKVVAKIDIEAVTRAWTTLVENLGDLKLITSEGAHSHAVSVLDELLDAARASESEALFGLIDLVSEFVEAYESRVLDLPSSAPADVLRLLMESNDLRQTDLADEMGGQSVVSDVLNGRREINAKQAGKLAARFGVSAALFVPKPSSELEIRVVRLRTPRDNRALKFALGRTLSTRGDATIINEQRAVVPYWSKVRGQSSSPTSALTMRFEQ